MRTKTIKLGDHELTLALSFKASMLIADRVMDPLSIANDQFQMAEAIKHGRAYEPKFEASASIVMVAGVAYGIEAVGNYLALLVGGEELGETTVGNRAQRRASKSKGKEKAAAGN